MSLADLPTFNHSQWTDEKGNMTSEATMYSDEMNQTLIQVITVLNDLLTLQIITDGSQVSGTIVLDGVKIPNKTTAEINTLEPDAALGTLWFDTSIAKLKVKTAAGTVETITSS